MLFYKTSFHNFLLIVLFNSTFLYFVVTKQKNFCQIATSGLTADDWRRPNVSHHCQHVEAGTAQQVAQVSDGGEGGDAGGEAPLPLGLGELEGAAQLIEGVPTHHRPDEHAVRFQHLLDLKTKIRQVSYML